MNLLSSLLYQKGVAGLVFGWQVHYCALKGGAAALLYQLMCSCSYWPTGRPGPDWPVPKDTIVETMHRRIYRTASHPGGT